MEKNETKHHPAQSVTTPAFSAFFSDSVALMIIMKNEKFIKDGRKKNRLDLFRDVTVLTRSLGVFCTRKLDAQLLIIQLAIIICIFIESHSIQPAFSSLKACFSNSVALVIIMKNEKFIKDGRKKKSAGSFSRRDSVHTIPRSLLHKKTRCAAFYHSVGYHNLHFY